MYHVAENFEGEKLMDFVGQNKAMKMIVYIGMVRRDMYQSSKILPMIITFQTEIVKSEKYLHLKNFLLHVH